MAREERAMLEATVRRFEAPDEVRTFSKGTFEIILIGGLTIGRATYQPGWRWSEDVGLALGQASCEVEHVGIVLAGHAVAAMNDGRVIDLRAGDVFHIAPGHDGWVVGDEPYVSLHLLGTAGYTR
jgi:hypothetical protein